MPKLLSLRDLCVAYCMNNIDSLLALDPLKEALDENNEEAVLCLQCELPADICDNLLDFHFRSLGHVKNHFLQLFKDNHRTSLSRISLRRMKGQNIEPWMLEIFCHHPLTVLEIPIPHGRSAEDSQAFTFQNLFEPLQNVKSTLKVLALHIDYSKDNRRNIMDEWIYRCILSDEEQYDGLDPTLDFPNLFSLTLKNFYFNIVDPEFSELFANARPFNTESEDEKAVQMQRFFEKVKIFRNVAHLDLTGCYLQNDCYFFLERCLKLTSLILTDIHDGLMNEHDTMDEGFMTMMQSVVKIKTLRYNHICSCRINFDVF
ncbi:hypothetical protein FSP39_019653 [Pinctada imbricata]|uniref:Uncharacterized protein n=1 Tax=Pinctada imbricata TaxID=66713 RepID=A0AA88XTJ8_PINIB|nr:hypothetical protein FSP39_019653 [Pinctada imbricata]